MSSATVVGFDTRTAAHRLAAVSAKPPANTDARSNARRSGSDSSA